MDTFNIIAGICSIVSLVISFFTASKVVKISGSMNITSKSGRQMVFGTKNKTAGGDISDK